MLDINGAFIQPPPIDPCIRAPTNPVTLSTYWDVTQDCWTPGSGDSFDEFFNCCNTPEGVVIDEPVFLKIFSVPVHPQEKAPLV